MNEWISVKDRLPDNDKRRFVLTFSRLKKYPRFYTSSDYKLLFFEDGYFLDCSGQLESVTHWMPLPDPPGGE